MKKMMIALLAMLTIAASGKAMSYEQARNEALFLTDKMAYELNLTDEQYEAAYEINLDYLMGVTSYDDVYGDYWERRNRDLSYILLDAQWQAYIAASYFYRPLYWSSGYWHFGIYARYPHRDYFFFGRPVFYATYRGAHAWHLHGTHGYYYTHRHHFRPAGGRAHYGMLDRWNKGEFRHHHGGAVGHHGGSVGRHGGTDRHHGGTDRYHGGTIGHHGGTTDRHHGGTIGNHGGTIGNHGGTDKSHGGTLSNNGTSTHHRGDFGGPRTSSTRTTVNHETASRQSTGSISRSSGSFGGSRSSGSFGGSRSSSSFGGGRSAGSGSSASRGSFGGGSRGGSSHGGGSRSGGSFGGRR